jgi:hypothetical protein
LHETICCNFQPVSHLQSQRPTGSLEHRHPGAQDGDGQANPERSRPYTASQHGDQGKQGQGLEQTPPVLKRRDDPEATDNLSRHALDATLSSPAFHSYADNCSGKYHRAVKI